MLTWLGWQLFIHTTAQSNGATSIGGVGSEDSFTGGAVNTACVGSVNK